MSMWHDELEALELEAIDRCTRRYMAVMNAHPDCRDPDHPGCARCEPDDEDQQEQGDEEE